MTTSTTQMPSTPHFCGGSLTDLSGNFTSPYYPSSYPHHLDCNWDMTVTPGSYINLQFSYFYLENGGEDCPYDYVGVSDSNYPLSSVQIKRCGYQSPWCVWSTSNVLHVRFVTDYSVSASGFMAHYATYGNPGSGSCLSLNATQTNYSMTTRTTQMSSTPPDYSMTTSTTQMPSTPPDYSMTTSTTQMPSTPHFCGGNLTDLSGNFTSPYYPSSYPFHLDCYWDITVTPGSYIYLQFSNFSLEYGAEDCPYDYVEVSDSNYPLSSIQIKRCDYQSPWCVWSTTNVLRVRFVTDVIVSAAGFTAHYATYGNTHSGNCLSLKKTKPKVIIPLRVVRTVSEHYVWCLSERTLPSNISMMNSSTTLAFGTEGIVWSKINHDGNYSCIATNEVGTESKTFHVSLIDFRVCVNLCHCRGDTDNWGWRLPFENVFNCTGKHSSHILNNIPTTTTVLALHNNEITELPEKVFSGLTYLFRLDLENNEITELPEKVFSGLTYLFGL
ncbi:tolloid-like protein 2 [Montipora foliosa]|uniref:tolloid-like protein 2 n=1 Tax=Montipora foliosa TaxID=591990 RepID=UPI0035F1428C